MFDENFIQNLPDDPGFAGKKIYDSLMQIVDQIDTHTMIKKDAYDIVIKGLAILQAFAESFEIDIVLPKLGSNLDHNIYVIKDFLSTISAIFERSYLDTYYQHFKKLIQKKFPRLPIYKFTDGDLVRIQTLINELRTFISDTKGLAESHKSRLLDRLEKLQSELHKSVSDLDKFWGLLIDASIVLKIMGENAKPIVDRVKEIIDIVWGIQIRVEELPSNTPLQLPSITQDAKKDLPGSQEE